MNKNRIFVHLPFSKLDRYMPDLERVKIQPEVYFSGNDLDNLDEEKLDRLAGYLKKENLSCTIHAPFYDLAIGSPDALIRDAVERRYRSLIPVIEKLRPLCMVIHTGYDRWRYGSQRDLWLSNATNFLIKLREMFPEDTKIAVENVFDEGPDVLYEIMNRLGPVRNLGICLDIGHFNLFSKAPLDEWLERLGDKIMELHIHDNDGREDRHWKPGKGHAPVFKLIRWAKTKDILMTIEVHEPKDALETHRMLLDT